MRSEDDTVSKESAYFPSTILVEFQRVVIVICLFILSKDNLPPQFVLLSTENRA
jgi:hypothetical protein